MKSTFNNIVMIDINKMMFIIISTQYIIALEIGRESLKGPGLVKNNTMRVTCHIKLTTPRTSDRITYSFLNN